LTTLSGRIDAGQRLWLEGVAGEQATHRLLVDNRQRQSINGLSVTIDAFDKVVRAGTVYDRLIQEKLKEGFYGGPLAMELLIADARHAADLLLPIFEQSRGLNGWVAVPTSPLLTVDTVNTAEAVSLPDAKDRRLNLMVGIAGLPSRLPVIETLITSGISINIGLIFSLLQFRAVAQTILQAFEACVVAGRKPVSSCFLTISVDRLHAGFSHLFLKDLAAEYVNAVLMEIGQAARNLFETRRWKRVIEIGARPPRLICSFADSIELCRSSLSLVGGIGAVCSVAARSQDVELPFCGFNPAVRDQTRTGDEQRQSIFADVDAGIEITAFSDRLQKDEADALLRSWIRLLDTIARKSAALTTVGNA
jgi:transaldolase